MEGFEKSSVAFIARIIKSKTGLSSELLKNNAFISYVICIHTDKYIPLIYLTILKSANKAKFVCYLRIVTQG